MIIKAKKVCSRGHVFTRTKDTPVCPKCYPGYYKKEKKSSNTIYHKDGSIWAKGKMSAGKPDGYFEWFRKPARVGGVGTIMRSGHFKKGKQVGTWTTYDAKGKVVKVTDFDK